jgi:hypothetical protein
MLVNDEEGYAGTFWNECGMEAMYNLLAPVDAATNDTVEDGWLATCRLTDSHLSAVTKYRDELALAWPPERSEAAAAFIGRLDSLVERLKETHEAAVTNHQAFQAVNAAIKAAQPVVASAYSDYINNEAALSVWRSEYANAQRALEVATQNGVRQMALNTVLPTPPVAVSVQEELVAKVRAEMYKVSSAAIESQYKLKQPKPYDPGVGPSDRTKNEGSGERAVALPPVIPLPTAASNSGTHDAGLAAGRRHSSSPLPAPPSGTPANIPVTGVEGPVLAGGQPTPGPLPNAPRTAPQIPGASPRVPALPGDTIVPPLPAATAAPRPSVGLPTGRAGRSVFGGGPASPPRGVPSNGVIGEEPALMPGGGTQPVPTRVNPVGGVIAAQPPPFAGAAARGAVPRGSTPAGEGGGMVGRSRQSGRRLDEPTTRRPWDPDDPWFVEEGVDPVVMPPPEPGPIDPGPAIGYTR